MDTRFNQWLNLSLIYLRNYVQGMEHGRLMQSDRQALKRESGYSHSLNNFWCAYSSGLALFCGYSVELFICLPFDPIQCSGSGISTCINALIPETDVTQCSVYTVFIEQTLKHEKTAKNCANCVLPKNKFIQVTWYNIWRLKIKVKTANLPLVAAHSNQLCNKH